MSDSIINLQKGDVLCSNGEDINSLFLIIKGKITAYSAYGTFSLTPGSIAGLTGSYYGISIYNYVADEDSTIQPFPFKTFTDVSKILETYGTESGRFIIKNNLFVMDVIKQYLSLLIKCRKKDAGFTLDNRINRLDLDKHNGLTQIPKEIAESFYNANLNVAVAELADNAKFANLLNDACLEMADYLEINLDYVPPVVEEPVVPEKPETSEVITEEEEECTDDITGILKNSLEKIIDYADFYEEDAEDLRGYIKQFRETSDRLALSDEIRKLRKGITDLFYKLYYDVFLKAISDESMPAYINMFLNFGYIDETLAGESACKELYIISKNIDNVCGNSHVYTMFNWMKEIYWGDKIPSRNMLDQSYDEFIKQESKLGKLDVTEDEALSDSDRKFKFELENLFRNSHYMTFGKVSTFVPIFIKENVQKSLKDCIMSAELVMQSINTARTLDFSLFYRSTIYNNEKIGLSKEFVYTEILPDIILSPCIGTKGVLWQEIEGRARASKARMIFPIFCVSKTDQTVVNVLGKYRYEICKRIQGAYWNIISEKSLTSEYYDYLLFYKKNRDLSDSVKEKIKSTLLNCRNNYTEVFAKDYENWILYESKGVARLNKVSRNIFAKYCPFNKKLRTELKNNPIFESSMDLYEKNIAGNKRRFENIYKMLQTKNAEIPKELRETRAYYNK